MKKLLTIMLAVLLAALAVAASAEDNVKNADIIIRVVLIGEAEALLIDGDAARLPHVGRGDHAHARRGGGGVDRAAGTWYPVGNDNGGACGGRRR